MKGIVYKIEKLIEETQLSEVKAKWRAPEGLFANGSAEEISEAVSENGKASLARAMERVTFYENRAGKNLSQERRATLEKAKNLIHAKYGKDK